jgi:hypothetical protein
MTLTSSFLNSVKRSLYQNAGSNMIDTSTYYLLANEWLQDIYFFMNTKRSWFHSFVEETISPTWTDGNEYRTTYPILWLCKEEKDEVIDRNWWVVTTGWIPLFQRTFATNAGNEFTYLVDNTTMEGIVGIKTHDWNAGDLRIRYFRQPTLVSIDTLTQPLDLPIQLTRALRLYLYMEMKPITYLDTGANMSQFYYSRYKEALLNYANSIGSDIDFNLTTR